MTTLKSCQLREDDTKSCEIYDLYRDWYSEVLEIECEKEYTIENICPYCGADLIIENGQHNKSCPLYEN